VALKSPYKATMYHLLLKDPVSIHAKNVRMSILQYESADKLFVAWMFCDLLAGSRCGRAASSCITSAADCRAWPADECNTTNDRSRARKFDPPSRAAAGTRDAATESHC
jgi:hypothetical protein